MSTEPLFLRGSKRTFGRLAAAYGFGIARNHPFVDGNKREAFLSIGLFLSRNGYLLEADEMNAADIMFRVASGELSEEELAAWIAQYSVVAQRKRT